MPHRLDTHVLTVDANVIHKVDTNPANLYSMWTVFSRCADSVEQGRRLENLSWRLWQKEQLIELEDKSIEASTACTAPQRVPSDTRFHDLPQLSGSVESIADADETEEFTSVSAPLEIARPRILRQDSTATNSRSRRDRHISSDDFEKMIVSIVKDKAPLSAPSHVAPMAPTKQDMEPSQSMIQRSGSTTTESQSPSKNSDAHSEESHPSPVMLPSTKVVRGFSPSQLPIPQINQPTSTPATNGTAAGPSSKVIQPRKAPITFTLGASYSSSEQGQSPEAAKPTKPAPTTAPKKPVFTLGASSEEEGSLKSALSPRGGPNRLTAQRKQASFSNHVTINTINPDDNAIDSDSEGDYIDESAIDDEDDSSDWEDSIEDSGKSSVDDKYFQRVDSKVNLTSRRSLITLMLAQNQNQPEERARALGNHASQSSAAIMQQRAHNGHALGASPNDSDEGIMMKGNRQLKPIREIPRSTAQPIPTATHGHGLGAQNALSPRTTRRNMLATELTESLRRHLLWERSQKSSTANAVLKRRHTSHDVANLKQYPEKPCMKKNEDVNASSWNQYFAKETFDGYHSKGW